MTFRLSKIRGCLTRWGFFFFLQLYFLFLQDPIEALLTCLWRTQPVSECACEDGPHSMRLNRAQNVSRLQFLQDVFTVGFWISFGLWFGSRQHKKQRTNSSCTTWQTVHLRASHCSVDGFCYQWNWLEEYFILCYFCAHSRIHFQCKVIRIQ